MAKEPLETESASDPGDDAPSDPPDADRVHAEGAEDEPEVAEPEVSQESARAPQRRLRFSAAYPVDPDLDRLLLAFEEGNYARVRDDAPGVAGRTKDPAVAAAAKDLLSRLSPDPLAVRMLVGAGLLLLFLVYWFSSDQH